MFAIRVEALVVGDAVVEAATPLVASRRDPHPQIRDLVRRFAEATAAQAEAMARCDYRTGNKWAKRRGDAFDALRQHGDAGRDALTELFDDPRPDVRVMAAAYLLRHSGAAAREVLEREARGAGVVAFGASEALKRWAEGTWALDPEESARVAPRRRHFAADALAQYWMSALCEPENAVDRS